MAEPKFDPIRFWEEYLKLPIDEMQAAWDALEASQLKTVKELQTFLKFAKAAALDVIPGTIEMLDPNGAVPPFPDLRCVVADKPQYFELGEITDGDLARAQSEARKAGEDVYGGFVSQQQPFDRIVNQKCGKRYTTNGQPLHLVVHFERQYPAESLTPSGPGRWKTVLQQAIKTSQFESIQVFDDWQKKILAKVERE